MPFNGSGTFNPLSAPTFPAVTGAVIFAARFNSNLTDIHQGLSNCLTRDGQSVPTANLPMGGMKLTGLAAGSVAGDSVRYEQLTALDAATLQSRGELSGVQDLNSLTEPGTYSLTAANTCTNIPTASVTGLGLTVANATLLVARGSESSTIISQVLRTAPQAWQRHSVSGVWSEWRRVGDAGSTIAGSTDFDTLTSQGTYYVSATDVASSTHGPVEQVNGTSSSITQAAMVEVNYFDGRITQKCMVTDGREYFRYRTAASVWSNWTVKYPLGYAGTFTPSLTAGTGTTGISYSTRVGTYWRFGPLIFFQAVMVFDHDGSWSQARLNVPVAPVDYTVLNNSPVINVTISNTIPTTIGSFFATFRATTAAEALLILGFETTQSGGTMEIDGNIPATTSCGLRYSGWYLAADNA